MTSYFFPTSQDKEHWNTFAIYNMISYNDPIYSTNAPNICIANVIIQNIF